MSLRVSNHKIYDPTTKILELEEQLRIKNSEIERLMLQMHTMSNHQMMPYSHSMGDSDDIMYHLAFMFSSPLVRRTNTNLEIIMQLDYHTEIKNIEKQLKGVKHEIRYKVDVATKSNFRGVIADAPFALHFTGHGIQNDQKALGTAYFQHKDKGDILLLEDENGMADYLFAKELQKVVELSKSNRDFSHNYEVVFVSSCYSEFTGKIFLESGARHVICIDKDERISDKASLRFSQVFYETLFVKKYSVCKAFELAKDDIRTLINNNEASKFKIMVCDNVELPGSKKASQHKCFPIAKFKEGTLTKYDTIPFFDCFPASVENFKGRQQEMCEVITLLSTNRLVNILGPPGIGKTSFARNLCNHIKDRKKYFDGILYVSLRGCESAHMFLTRLSLSIQTNAKIDDDQLFELKRISSKENSASDEELTNEEDQEKLRNFIIQILRDKEALILLDS